MERQARNANMKGHDRDIAVDDDCGSSFFKNMRVFGGGIATCLCIPFSCCCGPVVSVQEGYRAAILKFGKLDRIVGPGTYYYNPCTESFNVVSVQVQTLDVPQQNVITKDNITVTIHAVIYYSVINIEKAAFSVANVSLAVANFAQSTLRTVIGEHTMDELFNHRIKIVSRLTQLIDEETELWGVKVSNVEMKDISIPDSMKRVMAAVAEAQREGAAKVITAEAELRASTTLAEAADIMATNPLTIQLRYFQTLSEVSSERSSTIILPADISGIMARGMQGLMGGAGAEHAFDPEKAMMARRQILAVRDERLAREAKDKEPLLAKQK
jgi:regulator of protease activity HflC (stomatin/prohibitin superfamily)